MPRFMIMLARALTELLSAAYVFSTVAPTTVQPNHCHSQARIWPSLSPPQKATSTFALTYISHYQARKQRERRPSKGMRLFLAPPRLG